MTRDRFMVKGNIPADLAYQWVTMAVSGNKGLSQEEDFKQLGWRPVPAKRHPQMLHKGNRIIVGNMLLMQKSKSLVDAELDRIRKASEEQSKQPRLAVASADSSSPKDLDEPIREAKKTYRHPLFDYVVPVEVKFNYVLTERELETSIYLNLPVEEYARRKFLQLEGPHMIIGEGGTIFRTVRVEE